MFSRFPNKLFVGVTLLVTTAFSPSVIAANPDAGSILQQLEQERRLSAPMPTFEKDAQPKPELPDDPNALKVRLSKITFQGNTNIETDELTEAFSTFINTEQSFMGLQKIARMVGEYYRGKGLWAKAVLPQQSLAGGELILQIIEGKMGDVEIEHKEDELNFPENKSLEFLMEGQTPGEIFNIKAFQKAIKNLEAVPGVTAAAILKPGKKEGETDVLVRMANTPMNSGSIRIDNHGGRATSYHEGGRLMALLNIDSPFKLGEQINLQLVHSKGTNVFTGGFTYPIAPDGTRLGLNKTWVRYKLGHPLEAVQGKGDAQTTTLFIDKPLLQEKKATLNGKLDFSHNTYYNETIIDASHKTVDLLTGTLSAAWPDALGAGAVNTANLTYAIGDVDMKGATDAAGVDGRFNKINLQANRLQELDLKNQIWFSFLGQLSGENLDSGQKMSLGGPTAVRAYPGGEGSGDHGALVTVEWRHMIDSEHQFMLFYDHGVIRQNHELWSGWSSSAANTYKLRGWGVGLKVQPDEMSEVTALLANRIGDNPAADANGNDGDGSLRTPRFWINWTRQF